MISITLWSSAGTAAGGFTCYLHLLFLWDLCDLTPFSPANPVLRQTGHCPVAMGVSVATGTRLAGGVACAGGEVLGGKTAFTLLPLFDVDRGAEVGVEDWCGHSLV